MYLCFSLIFYHEALNDRKKCLKINLINEPYYGMKIDMHFLSRKYHHVPYQRIRLWLGNDFQSMKCKYCNIRTFLQKVNSISPLKISHTMIYVHTFFTFTLILVFSLRNRKEWFFCCRKRKNIHSLFLIFQENVYQENRKSYTTSFQYTLKAI